MPMPPGQKLDCLCHGVMDPPRFATSDVLYGGHLDGSRRSLAGTAATMLCHLVEGARRATC